jgi:hypothetical protein
MQTQKGTVRLADSDPNQSLSGLFYERLDLRQAALQCIVFCFTDHKQYGNCIYYGTFDESCADQLNILNRLPLMEVHQQSTLFNSSRTCRQ